MTLMDKLKDMCLVFILFFDKFLCLTNLRTRNFCQIIQKNVLYDKKKLLTKFGV